MQFQINTIGFVIIVITILFALVVLMISWKLVFGAETNITIINSSGTDDIHQYLEEMKYDTCHVLIDMYNLTEYYRCIGQ